MGNNDLVVVELPHESRPYWERRYPGRYQFELDALQSSGISPRVDADALQSGRLVLEFEWPLDAKVTVRLRAVYPDTFPHMRPQVFLLGGLPSPLLRHINPLEGNLCLLGRDTRQWSSRWSLCKLLKAQLFDAIFGTGEEDPQGEPAEYWWNMLDDTASLCLIDSEWDCGGAEEGTLLLQYCKPERESSGTGRANFPVTRAYVKDVKNGTDRLIHSWDGALPSDLASATSSMRIRWVRLEEPLLPKPNYGEQLRNLRDANCWLGELKPRRYVSDIYVDGFAFVHPSELAFHENGLGWVICLLFGQKDAFSSEPGRARRSKGLKARVLPIFRAGAADIGCRVPALSALRQSKVLLVGTGAIGAPLAVEFARNGCAKLQFVDHDIVEPGNTVRWPLGTSAWGKTKLEALKNFLNVEYPSTAIYTHALCFGQVHPEGQQRIREDEALTELVSDSDIIIDCSASHGVTSLLAEKCREANRPFISLSATPTVEGGTVSLHFAQSGCPNCLEYALHNNEIAAPAGRETDVALMQPPGCAERTFIGAGFDLQELSLQGMRVATRLLSGRLADTSQVYTLNFVDEAGSPCPPRWTLDELPRHPECGCGRT